MRKGLTELVFILDRSGSMSGLEADTIGGFNGMIEKQKKEEGEAFVSVILFDDQTQVQVALRLGMTQVQVSRAEKRILKKLRGAAEH